MKQKKGGTTVPTQVQNVQGKRVTRRQQRARIAGKKSETAEVKDAKANGEGKGGKTAPNKSTPNNEHPKSYNPRESRGPALARPTAVEKKNEDGKRSSAE